MSVQSHGESYELCLIHEGSVSHTDVFVNVSLTSRFFEPGLLEAHILWMQCEDITQSSYSFGLRIVERRIMSPALGSSELLQIPSTALLSSHILFLLEELWSNRKKRVSRFRRVPFTGGVFSSVIATTAEVLHIQQRGS